MVLVDRRVLVALLGALLASCAAGESGGDPAPSTIDNPPAARGGGGLEWQLEAQPSTLRMSERGRFVLRIIASNRGAQAVDTERDALALNVNGEDSMAFAMAFGNGGRDPRWGSLPPGERIAEERVGLELFDAAGDYELMLHRGERVYARASVRVTE